MPLYEVTSLEEVFGYLGQIIDGMGRDSMNRNAYLHFNPGLHCLHEAGWVHRDLSPGNIIVVEGKAKISDLEFAKRRAVEDLEQLTKSTDSSKTAVRDTHIVNLSFDTLRIELTP